MKKDYQVVRPNTTIKINGKDKNTGDPFKADDQDEKIKKLVKDEYIKEQKEEVNTDGKTTN